MTVFVTEPQKKELDSGKVVSGIYYDTDEFGIDRGYKKIFLSKTYNGYVYTSREKSKNFRHCNVIVEEL